ncbi:MAG: choice-of-anchor D domain-containing protein [Myxococcales bacterium]|nr:choice-of-anchor D domain-containing protein [Myxococcales bacterium]
MTVAPALANFGSAALTEQSAQQVFVLANTNAGAAAALSLTPPADFVVDNTGVAAPLCTASLAPAATCNIGVRFAPGSAGVKTRQFAFTAGSYAAVQGIGISNPNIGGLADNDFGTVTVGGFRDRSYIVTNGNVGTTGPLSFTITGTGAAQFTIVGDTCTPTIGGLAPGGTCSFTARFAPQPGERLRSEERRHHPRVRRGRRGWSAGELRHLGAVRGLRCWRQHGRHHDHARTRGAGRGQPCRRSAGHGGDGVHDHQRSWLGLDWPDLLVRHWRHRELREHHGRSCQSVHHRLDGAAGHSDLPDRVPVPPGRGGSARAQPDRIRERRFRVLRRTPSRARSPARAPSSSPGRPTRRR